MIGWFQATDSENTQLNDIANFLKKNRRAGRCKYFQNSTIYSLHSEDLKSTWLSRCNYNGAALKNIPKIKPSNLVYLIVSKNYKPSEEEPPFEPQVVTQIDEDEFDPSSDNQELDPESPIPASEQVNF